MERKTKVYMDTSELTNEEQLLNSRGALLYQQGGFPWRDNLCYFDSVLHICLGPFWSSILQHYPRFKLYWNVCKKRPEVFRRFLFEQLNGVHQKAEDPIYIFSRLLNWMENQSTSRKCVDDDLVCECLAEIVESKEELPKQLSSYIQFRTFSQKIEPPRAQVTVLLSEKTNISVQSYISTVPVFAWRIGANSNPLRLPLLPEIELAQVFDKDVEDEDRANFFVIDFSYREKPEYIPSLKSIVETELSRVSIPLSNSRSGRNIKEEEEEASNAFHCVASVVFIPQKNHYVTLIWNRHRQVYVLFDDLRVKNYQKSKSFRFPIYETWNLPGGSVNMLLFSRNF